MSLLLQVELQLQGKLQEVFKSQTRRTWAKISKYQRSVSRELDDWHQGLKECSWQRSLHAGTGQKEKNNPVTFTFTPSHERRQDN